MKLKITFVFLFFVAVFISCKKDEPLVEGNINGNGNVKNSVLLLSKIQTDSLTSFEYLYNSANLISVEKSKFYFTTNVYNAKNQLVSTDYYSNYDILSNDLQVFQTAMNQNTWITPVTPNKGGTMQYEYNAAGQLSKATYTPASGNIQYSEFSYGADGRISKQMLFWEDKETGYIDYTYDDKGNLTKEILYNLTSTGDPELSTTTQYEFDNQQNPYKSVSRLMTPGIYTNLNNIIKETYTIHLQAGQGSDNVQITQTTYVYNSKGYPVSKNGNINYIYG